VLKVAYPPCSPQLEANTMIAINEIIFKYILVKPLIIYFL